MKRKKIKHVFIISFLNWRNQLKQKITSFPKWRWKNPLTLWTKTLETSAKISLPQKVSTKEVKILVKLFLQSREMKSPPFFSIIIWHFRCIILFPQKWLQNDLKLQMTSESVIRRKCWKRCVCVAMRCYLYCELQ